VVYIRQSSLRIKPVRYLLIPFIILTNIIFYMRSMILLCNSVGIIINVYYFVIKILNTIQWGSSQRSSTVFKNAGFTLKLFIFVHLFRANLLQKATFKTKKKIIEQIDFNHKIIQQHLSSSGSLYELYSIS
jgi:hypothetical protein